MSTYRLSFDIELPDNISQDNEINFEAWLDLFIGHIENDIYNYNPLHCDIDVGGVYEKL